MAFPRFLFSGFFAATCALVSAAYADDYKIDPNHVNVVWYANHFGYSHPAGKFPKVEGTFSFDKAAPQDSHLTVTIDTSSLITGIPKFDEHIKSKDFLNVELYPKATFVSNKITVTGEDTADISGIFTLRNIAKPLVLKAKLNKTGMNPASEKMTAGFSATAIVKRADYGIVYALPGVADEVEIHIEVEGQLVN